MTRNVRADFSGSLKYPIGTNPPAAIMPISSDPGSTSRPSSVMTLVVGLLANLAVSVATPRIVTWLPIEPSVDPMASISISCGIRSRSCSFTSVVHITPDEMIILSDDRSYGSPRSAASSNALTSGLAIASPTSTINTARLSWAVRSTSCPSRLRLVSVTTAPPARWATNASEPRAPCRASTARSVSRSAGCRRR